MLVFEDAVGSFFDELEKVALNPMTASVIGSAIGGVGDLGFHGPWAKGGVSPTEARAAAELKKKQEQYSKALEGSDKETKEKTKKELVKAMKRRTAAAQSAEVAGSNLGQAAALGGGLVGARQLGKNIVKGEVGNIATTQQLRKLRDVIAPGTHVQTVPGGLEAALHIPKGGMLPRFARPLEEKMYAARGIDPSLVRKGFAEGVSLAPAMAGSHIGAHELGHAAFGASRLGRVTRALRMPASLGAGIGSAVAASYGDPEGSTSKYVAPALGVAASAPILGEEAAASIKAIKGMRRAGYNKAAIKAGKKQLAKAFGTYGLGLGLPLAAAPFIIRGIKKYRMKQRKERGLESARELKSKLKEFKGRE